MTVRVALVVIAGEKQELPVGDTLIVGPVPKTLFAENLASGDVGPGFFTKTELILSEMRAIIVGGASPSVTWTIRFAADRSTAGTEVVTGGTVSTNTTTGDVVTSFTVGTIPANSFVWLVTPTVTTGVNAPSSFAVTLTPA